MYKGKHLEHPSDVGRENRAAVEEVARLRQENERLRNLLLVAVGWWEENAGIVHDAAASSETELGETSFYAEDVDYKKCCAALGRVPIGERRD